eukprot:TRINITY_DN3337_c0_g1_i1.p1 TRINITY_DN3337_c0_g1~~TRINITY_DN3337_c0_g1_i1.p1  ORF type:complete len:130 (-),score=14.02 TRINITY_DN3337_c0_g1_i1:48-437(-)
MEDKFDSLEMMKSIVYSNKKFVDRLIEVPADETRGDLPAVTSSRKKKKKKGKVGHIPPPIEARAPLRDMDPHGLKKAYSIDVFAAPRDSTPIFVSGAQRAKAKGKNNKVQKPKPHPAMPKTTYTKSRVL